MFEIADIKELGENKEKENYKNKNEILAVNFRYKETLISLYCS